jgi:hypothetical protein
MVCSAPRTKLYGFDRIEKILRENPATDGSDDLPLFLCWSTDYPVLAGMLMLAGSA